MKQLLAVVSLLYPLEVVPFPLSILFVQDLQFYADIIMSLEEKIALIKRYYQRFSEVIKLLEHNNMQAFIKGF